MSAFDDDQSEPFSVTAEPQSDDESGQFSVNEPTKDVEDVEEQSEDEDSLAGSESDFSEGEDDVEDDVAELSGEDEDEDEDEEEDMGDGSDDEEGGPSRRPRAKARAAGRPKASGAVKEIEVPDLLGTGPGAVLSDDPDLLDSEEEDEDSYVRKLDESISENLIETFHPESKVHNFEEVQALCNLVRDANGAVVDPLHRTAPFMTKYEKTRLLGIRAKQLDQGATPLVKVPVGVIDGYTIALAELEQKRMPFIIRRPIPGGGSEYWRAYDLEVL